MNIIVNSITPSDLEKLEKSINHEVVYVKEMTQFFNDEIVKGEEGGIGNILNNFVGYTVLNVLGKDNIPINLVYVKDLTKARGGVYKNTSQNKKLGRIGAKYGEPTGGLANEIRNENKKAEDEKRDVKGEYSHLDNEDLQREYGNLVDAMKDWSEGSKVKYHEAWKQRNKKKRDLESEIKGRDKKAEGIKGGKKPQSDAQKKFTGDVTSGKTNLSEMADKKEDMFTDPALILKMTKTVNSWKERRNKSQKGSPEHTMLVSKIEAAEKRKVVDKAGELIGWKKK